MLALVSSLTLVACACTEDTIFETQAVVLAEGSGCDAARRRGLQVNAYRIVVFHFTGGAPGVGRPPCIECIEAGRCPVERQQCVCSHPMRPSTTTINRQLEGVRLADFVPDRRYCLGLIAYEAPDAPVPAAALSEPCDCTLIPSTPAFCGVGPFPTEVRDNSAAFFVTTDCQDACPVLMP